MSGKEKERKRHSPGKRFGKERNYRRRLSSGSRIEGGDQSKLHRPEIAGIEGSGRCSRAERDVEGSHGHQWQGKRAREREVLVARILSAKEPYPKISNEELKRLNAVESAFENPESIAKAIGNATKAVVTVGPGENGPSTAVTALDALKHVVLIYDVAATPVSTYNVQDGLSSFFSNIFSFNQELSLPELPAKVAETETGYTLIKANLADDYSPESSYSVVIRPEGMSKSQVATLVADVFSNIAIAENKVSEAVKMTSQLWKCSTIPEDRRRKAYAEAVARAKAEEEALEVSRKAQEAAKAARKLEEEVKKLCKQEAVAATLAEEAQEKAQAVGSNIEKLLNSIKLKPNEVPKVQLATIRGQAKAQTLPPKKTIVKPPKQAKQPQPPQPKLKSNGQKSEVRNVFGGLFKQETIYIDDD
ncbi:hypothetical protein EJ110_NYTH21330 [Nymphaea thermarum]|nr:hypothetical protein EJ110_NYTH21330 [Nymphaea thermarum]